MGTKVSALQHVAEKGNAGDPLNDLAHRLLARLDVDFDTNTDDQDALAASLLDLDEFKDLVKLANEAANELKEERNLKLYDLMVSKEKTKFDLRGQLFYLTSQNFVQADKEQGGTKNPALIEWLEDNGLGDLAARNVNANALRGAVNSWMDQHSLEAEDFTEEEMLELFDDSITFEDYEGVDGSTVTAAAQVAWRDRQREQFIAELDLPDELQVELEDGSIAKLNPTDQVIDRIARRQLLLTMVTIRSKPLVGMKKA